MAFNQLQGVNFVIVYSIVQSVAPRIFMMIFFGVKVFFKMKVNNFLGGDS